MLPSSEAKKMTNPTGLRDTDLVFYSPSATWWICLFVSDYGLGIHAFWPT